jgi:hypothetical protein
MLPTTGQKHYACIHFIHRVHHFEENAGAPFKHGPKSICDRLPESAPAAFFFYPNGGILTQLRLLFLVLARMWAFNHPASPDHHRLTVARSGTPDDTKNVQNVERAHGDGAPKARKPQAPKEWPPRMTNATWAADVERRQTETRGRAEREEKLAA